LAPSLTVSITPATFAENAGSAAAVGTVTRANFDNTQALTVNLASSNTSFATVPASVVIPAGQTSATFNVGAVDNGIADPTQVVAITASALAAEGVVSDTTFGTQGQAATSSRANAVAVGSDGKAVVVGSINTGSFFGNFTDLQVQRFNSDGSLDTTFGGTGTVQTDVSGQSDTPNAVAFQSDGKIVVAGTWGDGPHFEWFLERYNTDGTLDSTFGTGGKVVATMGTGPFDEIWDMAIQPSDGKIVVAGDLGGETAVARYNTDGTLDSSFGTAGVATLAVDQGDQLLGLALQSDGKIVAAGTSDAGNSDSHVVLLRLTTSGVPDSTFGTGGVVTTDVTGDYEQANDVAIQPDGKIVVAGNVGRAGVNPPQYDAVLARYNTDGTVDSSFGSGGITISDFGGQSDRAQGVAIDSDGSFIVVGQEGFSQLPLVARYYADGTLDTSSSLSTPGIGRSVAIGSGGRILVAGSWTSASGGFLDGYKLGQTTVSGSANVSVTDADDHAPVASDDSFTIGQGTSLTIAAPGVLGNDHDLDAIDTLTAALVASPAHGSVTLNADGSFTYTPDGSFTGTDSFTYQASDGKATSNVATVNIVNTQAGLSIGDVSLVEGNYGATNAVFTVTVSPGSGQTITVDYQTSDGTAHAGTDYAAASGTLTFAPGQTSQTIVVPIYGNTTYQADKAFLVTLSAASGAVLTRGQATGTITNDETHQISGTLYHDLNDNGLLTSGEPGLSGWTVYLDLNNNGQLDAGEPTTTTDSNGAYTFTNLASIPYTVGEVAPAGWQETDLGTSGLGALVSTLPISQPRAVVYDPFSNQLFITSNSTPTQVQRYDLTTGTLLTPWTIGGALYGADVTPDGKTLYVADASSTVVGGIRSGVIHKVDVATGTVTDLTYPLLGLETGAYDIAIASNGKAFFTSYSASGGTGLFRQIDLATGTITTRSDVPGYPSTGLINNDDRIGRGASRDFLFVVEPGWSNGPVYAYDATTDSFSHALTGEIHTPLATAVSRDGSMTAMVVGQAVAVFNRSFQSIAVLGQVNPDTPPNGAGNLLGGVAFDPVRDVLYTVDTVNHQVVAYDTHSWKPLYTLAIGSSVGTAQAFLQGEMTVSADGRYLFLTTATGVDVFTLPTTGGRVADLSGGQNAALDLGNAQSTNPSISVAGAAVAEGNSGTTTLTFTVNLSAASEVPVSVAYTTGDNSATLADGDYAALSGTLVFAPGQTSKTISVTINGDTKDEYDETFSLNLSNPLGATIAVAQAFGTIQNDDTASLGTITGTAFADTNGNGVHDGGDSALAGETVYLDLNQNGKLDAGEPTATTDSNGNYTFSNVPPGTYTVGQAAPTGSLPTAPTTTGGTSGVAIAAGTNPRDVAVDSARGIVYIATSTGQVLRYDLATQSMLTPWQVGVVLNGIGLSADGSTLYVGEDRRGPAEGLLYRVDTSSGAVTSISYPLNTGEVGTYDVAVLASGKVFFTTEGTGGSQLRQYDPATGLVTARNPLHRGTLLPTIAPNTMLSRSADGTTLYGSEPGLSGSIFSYDARTDTFVNEVDTAQSFLNRPVAASRDGRFLAQASSSGVLVYDHNFDLVTTLSGTFNALAFDPVQDLLFAADTASDQIIAYNTSDWTVAFQLAVGEDVKATTHFEGQQMAVSNDGRSLFLTMGTDVRMFRLNFGAAAVVGSGQTVSGPTFGAEPPAVPALTIGDVSFVEGNSGTWDMVFDVDLSQPSTSTVTAQYASSDGTATAGSDYTAVSGTLTFAPGQTHQTIVVPVAGDRLNEDNETFNLTLSSPSGASLGRSQAVGTIVDDDPVPSLSVLGTSTVEGNSGTKSLTFTVNLSAASGKTVTVNYAFSDGSAIAHSDYTGTNGTLTFAPGETSKTITAQIIGDTIYEPDESFTVTLSSPTGAAIGLASAAGTILNDDSAPSLSAPDASVVEGSDGTTTLIYNVSLTGAFQQPVTVSYTTTAGTATAGTDYTSATGTLTFNPGTTSQSISLTIASDTLQENNETFSFQLFNVANAVIGRSLGTVTIVDDDGPTLTINNVSQAEGSSGTTAITFTANLSAPSTVPISVAYATADGTATAGSDYTATSGTLTFAPGQTSQTITVQVNGDTALEADETFFVNLSNPNGVTLGQTQATGTISNDDLGASYVGSDLTSHGSWKGNYGTQGYEIAGDSSDGNPSLPAYVSSVSLGGNSTYVYQASTSDPRALEQSASGASSRVAAVWYAAPSFTITVNMADTAVHRVSLYAMDEDSNRSEQIDVINPANGQVLDTRQISDFASGVYLTWDVSGSVTFRVTRTAGSNAVISGLFLDSNTPVTPATAAFVKTDTTTQGAWKGTYGNAGYDIAGDTSDGNPSLPAYVSSVSLSGNSSYTYQASTSDPRALQQSASGASSRVAAVWYAAPSFTITVNMADTAVHRVSLYAMDEDSNRAEQIEVIDAATGQVLDTRQISDFASGIYLTWDVSGSVTFRVTRTAGVNAVISGLFFDSNATVTPGTASFVNADSTTQGGWKGAYGNAGYAVAGDTSVNNPSLPSFVSSVSLSGNSTYVYQASTSDPRALQQSAFGSANRVAAVWYAAPSFTITVNMADTAVHRVSLYAMDEDSNRAEQIEVINPANGQVLDTRSIANFASGVYLTWDVSGSVTFRITRTAGSNAVISGLFFESNTPVTPGTASFVKTDTTTHGAWKGVYGSTGYDIAGDTSPNNPNIPSSVASVALNGNANYTYESSTTDPRALQQAADGATSRIASVWYAAPSFTITVNMADSATHQVALYAMDEDSVRAEKIDVIDAASGQVLDTQQLSNFSSGTYLVWNVSGSVTFRITCTAGGNSVISGIFLD
jgi:uncharacterized delta-60 repeat protein